MTTKSKISALSGEPDPEIVSEIIKILTLLKPEERARVLRTLNVWFDVDLSK